MLKWNLLKIPLFSKNKFKNNFFNQTPQHNHFGTFNSPSMCQNSLGYAIKNPKILQSSIIIRHFQKNQKLQNLSHELEQPLFCQKLFLIQYFDCLCKGSKRNWVSTLLSSEMYGLSIGQGLTLSPMENYLEFL